MIQPVKHGDVTITKPGDVIGICHRDSTKILTGVLSAIHEAL